MSNKDMNAKAFKQLDMFKNKIQVKYLNEDAPQLIHVNIIKND